MYFTSVYIMWNIGSLIKVNYISCGIYTFKAHGTYIFVYNGIVWPNVLFVPICIIGHISWGWPTCIVHLHHYMLHVSPLVISHLDDQPVPSISITAWYMHHHWSYLIRMAYLHHPSPSLYVTHFIVGWPTCPLHLHHCMLHTSSLVISHQDDQPAPSISITACYISMTKF